MRLKTVHEARIIIEVFRALTQTTLHAGSVWNVFGDVALPAINDLLERMDDGRLEKEIRQEIEAASNSTSTPSPEEGKSEQTIKEEG